MGQRVQEEMSVAPIVEEWVPIKHTNNNVGNEIIWKTFVSKTPQITTIYLHRRGDIGQVMMHLEQMSRIRLGMPYNWIYQWLQ